MRTTKLRGARTNNLRAIDLDLEPGTLVVLAGPSGAGKSSLAFGTLYAEGQRRYVESFSAYARQFLERLERPPVDSLDPVPAAVAVDRQAPVKTSRSTVATMTEVADYAKSLWAMAAELYCDGCGKVVTRDSPIDAAARTVKALEGERVMVTYPLSVPDAESFLGVREALVADGYRRVLVGKEVRDLDEVRPSDLKKSKQLEVVADRAVAKAESRGRLIEAFEASFRRSQGRAAAVTESGKRVEFSSGLHCARCDKRFREPNPGLFSFNSPVGACGTCRGFGRVITIDYDLVLPDPTLSLSEGAIRPWGGKGTMHERRALKKFAEADGIPMDLPLGKFSEEQRRWLIDGTGGKSWKKSWWGLARWFAWLETRAYKMHVRVLLSRFRKYVECGSCRGARLVPEALRWRLGGHNLPSFYALPVSAALECLETERKRKPFDGPTNLLFDESIRRLQILERVGLGYLSLDRASRTLSGGEAQRVGLTSALGASLSGAMFVLDEPTVGLHPIDVSRLFGAVKELAHGDNVVLVVEHDHDVIRGADRVVELGPGAGERGGTIVFDGTPAALAKASTATGRALRSKSTRKTARRQARAWLRVKNATGHNLQDVSIDVPVGAITCVTGVSGSGKSSLILETLYAAVARKLGHASVAPALANGGIEGAGFFASAVQVDQSPLGRTSRGNPATYVKVWEELRMRLASEPAAKAAGYAPGAFSLNVPGGRCETCKGQGYETVEMQFLADVTFSCPDCGGKRFVGGVLEVQHRGKNAAELLELTASEALALFADDKKVTPGLKLLVAVGLGYLRLGQPLNTLSGGEAQRLKLAEALMRAPKGSLIVLDEPTAGLHADDVDPLLTVLDSLADRGDTVVVVEHDMRLAAHADHVIDLGPGAGAEGGKVVAVGTPEEVAKSKRSATAPFLAAELGMSPATSAKAAKRAASREAKSDIVDDFSIRVEGASEHNLKDVSVSIPREKLVVVTGPSGSGKSTLAFDVVFAEGQRRFLETLTPYARQYLPQLPRPNVHRVLGVPPSVSLEQRTTRGGANSTVATVTEIAHYLRLIYARAGLLHCPACKVPIEPRSAALIARDVSAKLAKTERVTVAAPVVRGRKGHYREVFEKARKEGLTHAFIDGTMTELTKGMKLDRFKEHDVDLVLGTVPAADPVLETLLERALSRGNGAARVLAKSDVTLVSSKRACPACGTGYPELDPRFFSFNTRQGQCETCEGDGELVETIGRGKSEREEIVPCDACNGSRLSPLARSVTVDGHPITDVLGKSVTQAYVLLRKLRFDERGQVIAEAPLRELERRFGFLEEVGLGYLGLDRAADTLSGGEMQRVRLAAQLGSGLTGVLYVLDEPTIGLHPRDTGRLIAAMRALVDRGNSIIVVEHDAETIRAADHVIDVGPTGGRGGGRVVAEGTPAELELNPESVTGPALARPAHVPVARRTTSLAGDLVLTGAKHHNLKNVTMTLPLGRLVAVTGVSGSGKSTLVRDVLLRGVRSELGLVTDAPGTYAKITGLGGVRRAVEMDQTPIGRTPRSVPATYVGIWDELRRLLASSPEAKQRGYKPSRFSFNVNGGRCEACEGQGALTVEMSFLPEALVLCDTCLGARFNEATLGVTFQGLNVAQILDLEVQEAVERFASVPKVVAPLRLLHELGLGYLKLGQPSNTLSGGEAQRLKLVAELGATMNAGSLYVMDEPTTGLHRDDVTRLIGVLERLVDRGDSVVVIEHQPDVILAADWVIDLGPEGGEGGGRIVAEGPPEAIMACKASHTGRALVTALGRTAKAPRKRPPAQGVATA